MGGVMAKWQAASSVIAVFQFLSIGRFQLVLVLYFQSIWLIGKVLNWAIGKSLPLEWNGRTFVRNGCRNGHARQKDAPKGCRMGTVKIACVPVVEKINKHLNSTNWSIVFVVQLWSLHLHEHICLPFNYQQYFLYPWAVLAVSREQVSLPWDVGTWFQMAR